VFSQYGGDAKNIKNLTTRFAILGWGGISRTEGDSSNPSIESTGAAKTIMHRSNTNISERDQSEC